VPPSAEAMDRLVLRLRTAGCVFAEDEARLLAEAADDPNALEELVVRREAGEPLELLLGWVEFCGLRLAVAPGVFVPRQRTALLVREVVALARPGDVVVDVGCGVGAIAAAVRAQVPGVEVYAVDVDPAAVACARRNLPADRVLQGDLYDPLPERLRDAVAVVVANAPYVPTAEIATMPREAREHEHRVALDGGTDGLDVQRRVIAGANGWLRRGGHLLIETGRTQLDGTLAALRGAGFDVTASVDEESGGVVARGTWAAGISTGRSAGGHLRPRRRRLSRWWR
jgi:release factor glutamine methyltransferase